MVTKQRWDAEMHQQVLARCLEDESFRERLLKDPKRIIEQEFNIKLPEEFRIKVLEDTETTIHFVIPTSLTAPPKPGF